MQDDNFYPTLEERSVFNSGLVLRQLREDPTYLDNPSCPYSPDLKAWFRSRAGETSHEMPGVDDLESEAEELFQELKQAGVGLTGNEKLQWLKASVQLFEKLVNLRERAAGVKEVAAFKNTLLEIIDSVLDPNQRTRVMDRINALL